MRIWQSRDEGINRNLLTDVDNGEILNVESEITQIDMADRNLAYYNQEIQRWLTNRDELTFAYDVTRGERLPSGTPLGSARLAAGMAGSYFDQIRENVAMDIKDMLYEVVIPSFSKENNTEHILRLAGEDLDELNNLIIRQRTKSDFLNYVRSKGKIPSESEFKILEAVVGEVVKRGKEKLVTIPKDFYKDIKYKIDITIVGEAFDVEVKAANLFAALQAITANPTLLTDPIKKKFFYHYLEQSGISPIEFIPEIQPSIESIMPQRAGGGISRPVPSSALRGKGEITL